MIMTETIKTKSLIIIINLNCRVLLLTVCVFGTVNCLCFWYCAQCLRTARARALKRHQIIVVKDVNTVCLCLCQEKIMSYVTPKRLQAVGAGTAIVLGLSMYAYEYYKRNYAFISTDDYGQPSRIAYNYDANTTKLKWHAVHLGSVLYAAGAIWEWFS